MTTTPRKPHVYYVVARYAGDYSRGGALESFRSRVEARRYARQLALSDAQHTVYMVLRDDQLALAQERGFTTYV
jgi:hypothetical protein